MKIEDIKKLSSWEILKQLQQIMRKNVNQMAKNKKQINAQIHSNSDAKSVFELQKNLIEQNTALSVENTKTLELHNKLFAFLMSLKDAPTTSLPELEQFSTSGASADIGFTIDSESLLESTINDFESFNETHPLYNDNKFRQKLLKHFISIEDYEKCDKLV